MFSVAGIGRWNDANRLQAAHTTVGILVSRHHRQTSSVDSIALHLEYTDCFLHKKAGDWCCRCSNGTDAVSMIQAVPIALGIRVISHHSQTPSSDKFQVIKIKQISFTMIVPMITA